jgi:transcriptional regulator with XRE-family HTH domain
MAVNGEKIRELREAKGLSQPELAKRARVSQQLIDQIERGKIKRTKFLLEIAKALDVYPYELDPSFLALIPHAEEAETGDIVALPGGLEEAAAGLIPIKGSVEAGAFREIEDNPEPQYLGSIFPDLPLPQWAYLVQGESMNRMALPGQYWIATPYVDPLNDARSGDYVIIERTRGHLRERSIKRLRFQKDGTREFWPESTDDRFKDPIRFDGSEDEQWEIIAKGLLVVSRTF